MGLVFAGQDFAEYGVTIDSSKSWPKPERDRTQIHVPGRNGDLILDNGCWKNVEISYHCLIKEGWQEKFEEFVRMLYQLRGYHELFDDDHPDVYRMAEFTGPIKPEMWLTADTGVFDLTFNCKPQQYLNSGEPVYMDFSEESQTSRIDNPTGMIACPIIKVYEAVNGALIVLNNYTIRVAPNDFFAITIDCENEVCYGVDDMEGFLGNANSYVTIERDDVMEYYGENRDFPYLPPTTGIYFYAAHAEYDPDDGMMDDEDMPEPIAVYTGSVELRPRLTRI